MWTFEYVVGWYDGFCGYLLQEQIETDCFIVELSQD